MLKLLVKKQLMEVFRGYFYDSKKNQKRSKGSTIVWFIFFAVIMIGVLGGMFLMLARSLCAPLAAAGMGWLYHIIMAGLAILLGAFGGVFNTYSGLYMGKDNDLLLSMPIPVKYIMGSRLLNVYIMGAMYAIVAIVPAIIVYWITVGPTVSNIICGLLLVFMVTMIVMILSCVLGWVVARLSLVVKRKSFAVVAFSLIFIALYYFFYFKASDLIGDIVQNAAVYGDKVRGAAFWLYIFGKTGEGDWISALICLAVIAAISIAVWFALSKTFMSIATASGKVKKTEYREKRVKEKSPLQAVCGKEISRFLSSSTYMLNSGLGILFLIISGVLILIKGEYAFAVVDSVFTSRPETACVIFLAGLCLMACMNNISGPSVSLEGKNIWILQSLPVDPAEVLRAKAMTHLRLSGVPMAFAAVCMMAVMPGGAALRLVFLLCIMVFVYFSVMFASFFGIKMPNLAWTSEVVPVKQGGAAMISIFGGWVIVFAFAGLYLLIGYRLGAVVYLAAWTVVFAAAAAVLRRWIYTEGAKIFAEL